ncbi:tRNA (uracil-5-)-methyltransferase [Moelleriella libera RCEF 2490]|uniref:tRNA (uracil(54)-C(5))-methyltransferase n=1 Tax=Moelleriella libera RCEF 2490 TaxID=1081109 RepID=A0A166VJG4_9HYPO|nr:tRNA (uracil-5-)-methyltransferase [Moelleriella libera RCEF 2490]
MTTTAAQIAAAAAAAVPASAPQDASRPAKRQRIDAPRKQWKQKKTKREKNITEGSSEEVLRHDIRALLASRGVHHVSSSSSTTTTTTKQAGETGLTEEEQAEEEQVDEEEELLPPEGTEVEVDVLELSSTGDGLAMRPGSNQVYVVPFTVPGDVARVRAFRHNRRERQTTADFLSVVTPSPLRDDARIRCRYFASCGGCQFQMLAYPEQLRLKKRIVEKAYRHFAGLAPEHVPAVHDTIGSPLQYGYRTKLTPHFDGPPGFRPHRKHNNNNSNRPRPAFESCPDIGFMKKGQRKVLDIEDCPIGTEAVRLGMARERKRMQVEYGNYTRGATILLRENTTRLPKNQDGTPAPSPSLAIAAGGGGGSGAATAVIPTEADEYTTRTESETHVDIKSCVTDSKATTTEYIDDLVFTNPAGSFFQNNNSILPVFTAYVRDRILPPSAAAAAPPSVSENTPPIKYLIDAYSGSGLFTITLASSFQHSTGIDIAADSIASARKNASLNGLGDERCRFIAADAGELFKSITYPPDETVVVLDPPRKGCDADFLAQLRRFAPRRILYVSCNVHTQARDVGVLVRGQGEGARYQVESLVGFDFFPQTGHVEGVAILSRTDKMSS